MVWGDQDAGGEVLLRLLRQILAGHPQRSEAPPSGPLPPTRPFPLVPILLLYPPCASPRHLSPLRPHRKMMMPFITSSFLLPLSLSCSSSAFFHWFHFSVSSLIILFNFSSFALPKGFCQYGDACKYFHPPLAQPLPGLSCLSPYPLVLPNYLFFHLILCNCYQSLISTCSHKYIVKLPQSFRPFT